MVFEHHSEPLLPREAFLRRVAGYAALSAALIATALGIGVAGYHLFEDLPWIDALLNASMILGGMGPVNPIATPAGKLFASFYALFSGLIFVGTASIFVAPFVHRLLHGLHLEESDRSAD